MRINVMIEGQENVTWEQWQRLAETTERVGLEGLFRSDHYRSVKTPDDIGSLDAWTTLAALAARTRRIRLGTLVSPATFRHPSVLAKAVTTVDHVSQGRVELGLGAGWHEGEHRAYGFPFADVRTRYDVFGEQLEIVARQLRGDTFDFHGQHYELEDCRPRPTPVQRPRVPIIVGGRARPRGVALAVRWADEYNTLYPTPAGAADIRARLDAACERAGRVPLRLSVMTGVLVGRDEAEYRARARRFMEWSGDDGDLDAWLEPLEDTWVLGPVERAAERIEALAKAGVERVMLQHRPHDDLDAIEVLARLST